MLLSVQSHTLLYFPGIADESWGTNSENPFSSPTRHMWEPPVPPGQGYTLPICSDTDGVSLFNLWLSLFL